MPAPYDFNYMLTPITTIITVHLHLTFTGRTEPALCVAISRVILCARVFATLPPTPPDARLLWLEVGFRRGV